MQLVRVQASQLMLPDCGVQWGSGLLRSVSRRCSTRVLSAHCGEEGMKLSANGVLAVLLLILLATPDTSFAEGRCPPGQYPVGGQGAGGCAPIPTSASGDEGGPRPTGRWLKTWGAIALSTDGASGAATGRLTKAAAARDAEAVCVSSGGTSCKVAFTYKNQCAAASVPTSGLGGTSFGRGPKVDIAEQIALDLCAKAGGVGCRKIYSACTEPQFEAF